jgi:hypothetical protein
MRFPGLVIQGERKRSLLRNSLHAGRASGGRIASCETRKRYLRSFPVSPRRFKPVRRLIARARAAGRSGFRWLRDRFHQVAHEFAQRLVREVDVDGLSSRLATFRAVTTEQERAVCLR